MAEQLRIVEHAGYRHPHARNHHADERRPEGFRLAEQHVGESVHQVGDGDGALVSGVVRATARDVSDGAAQQQADPRESPDVADPRRAAMEHLLPKQSEKDLCRAATHRPTR